MSDTAASLGMPGEFDWKGRKWLFDRVDSLGVIAEFTDWLIEDAKDQLRKERKEGKLSDEEFSKDWKDLRQQIYAKEFAWRSSICCWALSQTPGMKKIAHLMLSARDRKITEGMIDELWDDPGVGKILVKMELLKEMEPDDPNPKGPTE